jgi:protein-tyrosine phosphatase
LEENVQNISYGATILANFIVKCHLIFSIGGNIEMNNGNLATRHPHVQVPKHINQTEGSHSTHSHSHSEIFAKFSQELHNIKHHIAEKSNAIAEAIEKKVDEVEVGAEDLIKHMAANPHNHYGTAEDTIAEMTSWVENGIHWFPGDPEAKSNGIENFAEVRPGFYRGHVPSSKESFDWMLKKGIGTEIDLRQEWEKPQTGEWAEKAGVKHIGISIPDVGTPNGEQINQLFSVIDAAKEKQTQDPDGAHGIFIHCKAGANRTGTTVALASIREGMNPDEAVKIAETRGMFPVTYQPVTQKAAIDEINFILKYGDAYQALDIKPRTPEEQRFNVFFSNYIEQHKCVSRSDFTKAVIAAWQN